MKWNKRTSKVFIYTILLLSIIGFSTYPTSHSKYLDIKPNLLSFNSKFYELYHANKVSISLKEDTSSLKTAQFSISFPRNKVGDFKTKDVYEMILKDPSGAVIPSNKCAIIGGNTKTYQKNSKASSVSVVMSCPNVEDVPKVIIGGVEFFNFSVEIKEKFDEEEQFTYTDGRFTYSYPVYIEKYTPKEEVPKELVIQSNETAKYNKFIDWINKTFATENTQNQKNKEYINKYIEKNDDAVWNLELPGITVKKGKDPTTGIETRVYSISENLPGYVEADNSDIEDFMYFSTTDEEELELAFKFYLKKYYCVPNEGSDGCTLDQESYDLVREYVQSFNGKGISYIILENGTIPGLSPDKDNELNTKKIIIMSSNIKDYAYNRKNKASLKIRITPDTGPRMWNVFTVGLQDVYGESIISSSLTELDESAGKYGLISAHAKLYSAVTKNATSSAQKTPISINENFIVYDDVNKHSLLIHVYSNAGDQEDDPYTYVEVNVTDEENIKALTETKISLAAKRKEDIIKTIQQLDTWLGQTTTIDETKLVPNGLGVITINYVLPVTISE